MKKSLRKVLSILLAAAMSVSAFSAAQITAGALHNDEENAVISQAFTGEGMLNTFIGEKLGDEKISDPQEAYDFVMSNLDRIGGDETTELDLYSIRQNENGMTIISYSQQAGSYLVYGASVKLILDKDDYPIGIVRSIVPDVKMRAEEEWAVTAEQAEEIVMGVVKDAGAEDELVEGLTDRVIIPYPGQTFFVCAWIVYTYDQNADPDSYAYKAHYVSAEGEYMYQMAVSQPGDPDAEKGQSAKAAFNFDAYEKDEMTVSVNQNDGTVKDITVPVLKDTKKGKTYLADPERKILCADYSQYTYQDKIYKVVDGKTYVGAKTEDTSYKLADVPKTDYQVFVVAFDDNGAKVSSAKTDVKVG